MYLMSESKLIHERQDIRVFVTSRYLSCRTTPVQAQSLKTLLQAAFFRKGGWEPNVLVNPIAMLPFCGPILLPRKLKGPEKSVSRYDHYCLLRACSGHGL